MSRFIITILICAVLFGCKSGIPKEIIQPAAMEQVLFDIHIVDGYTAVYSAATSDSLKKVITPYYKGVYKKHHIDSAIYRKSLEYYYEHPEVLKSIYDNVTKKLAATKDQVAKANAKEEAAKAKAAAAKAKAEEARLKAEAEKTKAAKAKEEKGIEKAKPGKVQ